MSVTMNEPTDFNVRCTLGMFGDDKGGKEQRGGWVLAWTLWCLYRSSSLLLFLKEKNKLLFLSANSLMLIQ